MAKKSKGKPWSKETRYVCGIIVILAVVLVLYGLFSLGGIMKDVFGTDEFEMPESCLNDSDCYCPPDIPICEILGPWECVDNECISQALMNISES
jgi:hypothetical protein